MRTRHITRPVNLRMIRRNLGASVANKLRTSLRSTKSKLVAAQREIDRLDKMFNALPVGVHILDVNGVIKKVNDSEAEMLGRSKDELKGSSFLDLIPQEQREEAWQRFQAKIAGKKVDAITHRSYVRPDGDRLYVFSEDRLIKDRAGQVTGVLTVLHNITELNQIHERSARTKKLEALGQVAAGVAHHFNNLLGAIMMGAELLLHKNTDERSKETLNMIIESCKRGKAITDGVLHFTRKAVLPMVKLNAPRLIANEVMQELRDKGLINGIIIVENYDTSAKVKMDPRQLGKMIRNVMVNSITAVQDVQAGEARIALTVDEREFHINQPTVSDHHLKPGRYVAISVEDNGSGIPPEIRDRVFDPFFSTEDIFRPGLGLSEALGIAESTDGGIKLSNVAEGTKINIFLPIAPDN